MNYCDCPNCKTDDCPAGIESNRIDEAYEVYPCGNCAKSIPPSEWPKVPSQKKKSEYMEATNQTQPSPTESQASTCSGFRVTLEAVGFTPAGAMAHALKVISLMMESAHTKGHCCGDTSGNASAKLDVIP